MTLINLQGQNMVVHYLRAQNGLREFCANAPIIDSGGKVFAPCQNREYDSEHIGELGATMSVGKLDDEFTSSFGLSGGYTFNPRRRDRWS